MSKTGKQVTFGKCPNCKGGNIREYHWDFMDGGKTEVIQRVCLICGKDFLFKREIEKPDTSDKRAGTN